MKQDDFVQMRLLDVPGYLAWSDKHHDDDPALIAHLDATNVLLRPSELNGVTEAYFDELLDSLREEFGH